MKKTCEECANCYNEYMLGGYPTPVCKIYGYLEETDNPHHDLDGEKCPDYTYPTTILCGLRAKTKPIDDWEVSEELKEMISEVYLECDALALLKEQKHGHWVLDPDGMDWNIPAWRCSVCGCRNDNIPPDVEKTNPLRWSGSKFCPNCGAKMDEEVKQNDWQS